MNQIFFDKNQSIFIKVFSNSEVLEREESGIANLRSLVFVPLIKRLDNKVAKITFLEGFLGYQVLDNDLNMLISKFLLQKKSKKIPAKFTIFSEINKMRKILKDSDLKILLNIEEEIKGLSIYPVHGDLQKQNIIISRGKLGLIDFEHFMFAPKELELVNSMFYDDGNCLDVQGIINFLPDKFIDQRVLISMLKFYYLRQIFLGMSANKALIRLTQSFKKIKSLNFARTRNGKIADFSSSFCYI